MATSLPPEVLPVKGEATEDGEDSSLSMLLPLEQSPLSLGFLDGGPPECDICRKRASSRGPLAPAVMAASKKGGN